MPPITLITLCWFTGLLAGLTDFGTWAAIAALIVAPWRRRALGPIAPVALVLAVASLTGDAVRRGDEACRATLGAGRAWIATIGLDAAEPGGRVRARLGDGRCETDAMLMVAAGRGDPGGVVRVIGRAEPNPRGLRIVAARIAPTAERDVFIAIRARAAARLDALLGPHAPMARALLVADTRDLAPDLRDRFADSGLVHALSISGLHVAIVAGALTLLFGALRAPAGAAAIAALIATAAYVVLLGAPPPAVRSAMMLGGQTIALRMQRPTSPWAVLAWGALIPLLINPRSAIDVGYQLSVGGMTALMCARPVATAVGDRWDGWRSKLASAMTAGVVVTLLTAPLVAWHIGRLSLVAPLTNMAAEPVLDGLQPALFGVLAAAPWDAFARVVAAGATPLLWAFDAIARVGASVPGAAISVAPTPVTALLAGVAVLGFGAACLAVGTNRTRGRPLLVGTAALAAMCWWPGAAGSGWLELHAIDVGQGDAIALRTPHGQWILVDAGPAFGASDAGRSTVVPYLRRRGGSLAAFVLTHPDADHAGGAASVLRAFTPPVVFDPGFVGATGTYRATLEAASAPGTQWRRARAGDSLAVDGVVLTILAPDSAWMSHASSPNDASVVAMVRLGDVRFLLTGDAEAPEEQSLVDALGDRLRADVLKVGHHGSRTSSSAPLLDAVRPRVAVVSVGAHNRYRHPSEAVMTALAERGVEVLRTDRLGSIVVRTDGMHIEVRAGGDAWNVR